MSSSSRFLLFALISIGVAARNSTWTTSSNVMSNYDLSSSLLPSRGEKCPPCFNCLLPAFTCGQYGNCDPFNGQCNCPPGWGGIDCLTPQCDSLADGDRRKLREEGKSCECKDGWEGINCNVCSRDESCIDFPLAGQLRAGGELSMLEDDGESTANMTCYKGGETVFNNHQMCDVTNRKILDMLPDRPPQVTFSCLAEAGTCDFQFWTAGVESFYCALDTCKSSRQPGYDTNTTVYACENVKCSCITGRFICGEDGSVDIGDFLKEEIKGPSTFSCKNGGESSSSQCRFEEPAMNQLINDIFGDGYISLTCKGGECLHYSQVPGYVAPPKPNNTVLLALSSAVAGVVVLLAVALLWYVGRVRSGGELGEIRLPADEAARLMRDHVPAHLYFENVTYELPGNGMGRGKRVILDRISGSVAPGQVLAIMGASGAGKTTFLDILARKRKRGTVHGRILVNGREVHDSEFRSVAGFVDQEDTLMSTLTVYETVLYSALLRLPREMSIEAKKYRTLETMNELGILGIKDMRIGDSGRRSISGGEKRRVSIACELVTSPSILFLDEPTSGLDAYNAFNVVESLVSLARNYNRTVVFTIHQPRSNIVALFDRLLVLAQGKMVYSGNYSSKGGEIGECQEYFENLGHPCPPGFNIADFLIDLTMQASIEEENNSNDEQTRVELPLAEEHFRDEERGLARPSSSSVSAGSASPDETELQTRPNSLNLPPERSIASSIRQKTTDLFDAISQRSAGAQSSRTLPPKLQALIDAFLASDIHALILEAGRQYAARIVASDNVDVRHQASDELPDVAMETTLLRGRKRASWTTQFRILSGRAFKNLYRDPALLAAHYLSAIALALICGLFFHNVTNDIPGFQNRLGIFAFTLALFGFSCLSSLGLFANERVLFMRERSNGYYSTFTYFSSKVLFDILPLRLVPPLLFGGIVYGLVGLVPTVAGFWKFMLTLVLFNLTTASIVLWLSIAIASTSVASLAGTLIMLFNLLFMGLFINRDSVISSLQWLHTISFFHAGFEALAVNELRYLQLKEIKFGVSIDVPAAAILSMFGLRAQSFWWPNITLLCIFFGACTVGSFLTLHFFVKEKR